MKKPSRVALMGGYALVGLAAVGVVGHLLLRQNYSAEINSIIIAGDALVAAVGAATVLIANALDKVEERIRRLEAGLKAD